MTKPRKCPNCGSTMIVEIIDGQWTKTYFDWNSEEKKYEVVNEKTDGTGDCYFECGECGETLNEFTEIQEMLVADTT